MAFHSTIATVRDIWAYRSILVSDVYADLKSSVAGTPVGYLWWFIEPLAMGLVFYFVLGIVFERVGPEYLMQVLTALIAWQWFARSIGGSTIAFTKGAKFISTIRFPLSILVMSTIFVNLVYGFFGLVIIIFVNLESIGYTVLYLPIILLVQFIITLGLGLLLATGNVFLRDIERMIPVILRTLWFLSPVFYQVSDVLQSQTIPEWGKMLFQMNPLSTLLTAYRSVILFAEPPAWDALAIWAALGLVLIALGNAALTRASGSLAKLL